MISNKYEFNSSYKERGDKKQQEQRPESTQPTAQKSQAQESSNKYMRIITEMNDPALLKLKRGKNTPAIHIFTMRKYMEEFKNQYLLKDHEGKAIADYYPDAREHLLKITDVKEEKNEQQNIVSKNGKKIEREPMRKNVNTKDLVELFGGEVPDKHDKEAVKWFMIRRMNARVLEMIYQKHQVEIMFGSSKMEDKLTNSLFIYEYRTRLPNPLLCGGLECIRPMEKQKKYPKKKKQVSEEKVEKAPQKKRKLIGKN